MIHIAVCEEDSTQRDKTASLVDTILTSMNESHDVEKFESGGELMRSRQTFDIIFLDIRMNGRLDGIDTAHKLRERDGRAVIVFLTQTSRYIYEASHIEEFSYLLLPLQSESVVQVVGDAVKKLAAGVLPDTLIGRNKKPVKVSLENVLYFEASRHIIRIHTADEVREFDGQINKLEEQLAGAPFFRCHKNYIVHLKYAFKFDRKHIELDNGDSIPLSEWHYDAFSKAMAGYLTKEGVWF